MGSTKPLIIAIDGPAGAGKGTVARAIASALGYRHIDTGAMYRAVAWKALRDNVLLTDEEAVSRVAEQSQIEIAGTAVAIGGRDVTRAIRTPEIDHAAASVARLARVRVILVARQRELGAGGGIVMEGRDIGTVVFPRADVKLYLDAAPAERARRRAIDQARSGGPAPISDVATLLKERDRLDVTRTASPLVVATDAIVIDATAKSIGEVVDEAMTVIKAKAGI